MQMRQIENMETVICCMKVARKAIYHAQVAKWSSGQVANFHVVEQVVKRPSGQVVKWSSGQVEKGPSGKSAEWSSGQAAK